MYKLQITCCMWKEELASYTWEITVYAEVCRMVVVSIDRLTAPLCSVTPLLTFIIPNTRRMYSQMSNIRIFTNEEMLEFRGELSVNWQLRQPLKTTACTKNNVTHSRLVQSTRVSLFGQLSTSVKFIGQSLTVTSSPVQLRWPTYLQGHRRIEASQIYCSSKGCLDYGAWHGLYNVMCYRIHTYLVIYYGVA